jgi:hypothetical protein
VVKNRLAKKHERIRASQADLDAQLDNEPFFQTGQRPTIGLIEAARDFLAKERGVDRTGVSSYAIAQHLGIAQNRISLYQLHGGSMDNKLAVQIAKLVGLDPLKAIAAVEAERAPRTADKTFWSELAKAATVGAWMVGTYALLRAYLTPDLTITELFSHAWLLAAAYVPDAPIIHIAFLLAVALVAALFIAEFARRRRRAREVLL